MEILLGLIGVAIGVWVAWSRRDRPATNATNEKPGHIYFLENQNNPGKVKIISQSKELVTPMRVLAHVVTATPNAILNEIYHDLEAAHISGGWYHSDSARMYIDHMKGAA